MTKARNTASQGKWKKECRAKHPGDIRMKVQCPASDLEDPGVGAGGEAEFVDGRFQEGLGVFLEFQVSSPKDRIYLYFDRLKRWNKLIIKRKQFRIIDPLHRWVPFPD